MSDDDSVTLRPIPDDSAAGEPVTWRPRVTVARVLVPVVAGAAGFLFVTSATSADGTDLRAERQTDLTGLVRAQSLDNQGLAEEVSQLRDEVDELSEDVADARAESANEVADELAGPAGMTAVQGEGVQVTLDDAPSEARSDEIEPDALIVHQQDIQAVVNALWTGGAEAVSIQGQRVISTSAIRCVGNSVVLHGVPYPPPYEIEAIGRVDRLIDALNDAPGVRVYLDYVERFGLGYQLEHRDDISVPGFQGSLDLTHAEAMSD